MFSIFSPATQRLETVPRKLAAQGIPFAITGAVVVRAYLQRNYATLAETLGLRFSLLLERANLPRALAALHDSAQVYHRVEDAGANRHEFLLDGSSGSLATAIRLHFVGERTWPDQAEPNPSLAERVLTEAFPTLLPPTQIRMHLSHFRDEDRVLLRALAAAGRLDAADSTHWPKTLRTRLELILDTPLG